MRPNFQGYMPQELNQVNLPMQTGYGEPGSFSGWLTSPQVSQGLMGAGQAILAPNSGYGGNVANAFGGFNEGMQAQKQREIDNAIKANNTYAALGRANGTMGGGTMGALAMKLQQEDPNLSFIQALDLAKSRLVNQGVNFNGKEAKPLLGFNPTVAGTEGAKQNAKNQSDLDFASPIAEAGVIGKGTGESQVNLSSIESKYPQLLKTVDNLKELGNKATYTYAGQAANSVTRQMGLPVGEGAIAREEYISQVKNQVFPLLRDTFGAQFTRAEGDSLLTTLGDPNKSPEEKDAALRSFIQTKEDTIDSERRKVDLLKGRTSGIGRIGGAPKVQKSQLLPPANSQQPSQNQQRKPLGDIFK